MKPDMARLRARERRLEMEAVEQLIARSLAVVLAGNDRDGSHQGAVDYWAAYLDKRRKEHAEE